MEVEIELATGLGGRGGKSFFHHLSLVGIPSTRSADKSTVRQRCFPLERMMRRSVRAGSQMEV